MFGVCACFDLLCIERGKYVCFYEIVPVFSVVSIEDVEQVVPSLGDGGDNRAPRISNVVVLGTTRPGIESGIAVELQVRTDAILVRREGGLLTTLGE